MAPARTFATDAERIGHATVPHFWAEDSPSMLEVRAEHVALVQAVLDAAALPGPDAVQERDTALFAAAELLEERKRPCACAADLRAMTSEESPRTPDGRIATEPPTAVLQAVPAPRPVLVNPPTRRSLREVGPRG